MRVAIPIAVALFCLAGDTTWVAASEKPNIIFVLADDLGLDGVSSYGAERHKTPHIDALAASGIRFTTAYASPLCGATRSPFLDRTLRISIGRADEPVVAKRPAGPPSRPTNRSRIVGLLVIAITDQPAWSRHREMTAAMPAVGQGDLERKVSGTVFRFFVPRSYPVVLPFPQETVPDTFDTAAEQATVEPPASRGTSKSGTGRFCRGRDESFRPRFPSPACRATPGHRWVANRGPVPARSGLRERPAASPNARAWAFVPPG